MRYYSVLEPAIGARERRYVNDCVRTGWIGSWGKYIGKFEKAFADFTKTKFAVSVSNGTVSLHTIFLALGIGKGDEVIVPNFTYVASANAVRYVGAKPVFVDCEADTFNIDPRKIEDRITPRTKAILVVHLFGNPCRMDDLKKIARRHRLLLIEDAAQAHGARYHGAPAGSFGVAASFSFFGSKTIATGEGGMVVTNVRKIGDHIRLLKNQGQSPRRRYAHDVLGYNYRMTNIQAALGVAQLERVSYFLRKKRKINSWYREYLDPLVRNGSIGFQAETPRARASWWVTTIVSHRFPAAMLADYLKKRRIDTRPFFIPMNEIPHLKQRGVFPNSKKLSVAGTILPSSVMLSKKDVASISEHVKGFFADTKRSKRV